MLGNGLGNRDVNGWRMGSDDISESAGQDLAQIWDSMTGSGGKAIFMEPGIAPPPRISSHAPRYTAPPAWYPPSRYSDANDAYYTTHTDVLATVADTIRAGIPGLQQAVSLLRSFTTADLYSAIPGGPSSDWSTGPEFMSMALSAQTALIDAAGQIAGLHIDAVRKLAATASSYAQTEDAAYRQAKALEKSGQPYGTLGEMPARNNPRAEPPPAVLQTVSIKDEYPLQPDQSSLPWPQIMDILHGIVPAVLGELGVSMLSVGGALDDIATDIVTGVATLAKSWQGGSAQTAF